MSDISPIYDIAVQGTTSTAAARLASQARRCAVCSSANTAISEAVLTLEASAPSHGIKLLGGNITGTVWGGFAQPLNASMESTDKLRLIGTLRINRFDIVYGLLSR